MRRGSSTRDDAQLPETTMVLTLELKPELGLRLRKAVRRKPGRRARDITIDALETWLARDEAAHESD